MAKWRVVLSLSFAMWEGEQQVPPLRFAPVGMTLLFWSQSLSKISLLSCRSLHCASLRSG
jgi:hypothetical protein